MKGEMFGRKKNQPERWEDSEERKKRRKGNGERGEGRGGSVWKK